MDKETIEKLKELAKYQIIEKDGQIIFVKRDIKWKKSNKK